MIDSQLILVEGMPSTGKTTNSRFIHIQLERNGIKSEWVHEVAMPQPVLFFDEVGLTLDEYQEFTRKYTEVADILNRIAVIRKSTVEINLNMIHWYYEDKFPEEIYQALLSFDTWKFPLERYKRFALEKWSTFTKQAMKNEGQVYIIDSAIFQFQIFTFLFQNRPYEELQDFVKQITDIIQPLRPTLFYLYRDDAEVTINYLEKERGTSYLEYLYQRDKDQPYYRDKPAGADSFKQFLRDYNDLDNHLCASFSERKLSLEISRGNWTELEDRMLSFLELQRMPDVEAYPQNGCYKNEELGYVIQVDGLSMVDPTGKERKLIAKGENEFYVDWLPVCILFQDDRIVISGSPIGDRWTTTGLEYTKDDKS